MRTATSLVMPLLPASIAGIVSHAFDCVPVELAAPDGTYRTLAGFILSDSAQLQLAPALAVCPRPVFRQDGGGNSFDGYDARSWIIVHRATGIELTPPFHFNLAVSLMRDLEVAANWERMTRSASARSPNIAIPRWQQERVLGLMQAAVKGEAAVR